MPQLTRVRPTRNLFRAARVGLIAFFVASAVWHGTPIAAFQADDATPAIEPTIEVAPPPVDDPAMVAEPTLEVAPTEVPPEPTLADPAPTSEPEVTVEPVLTPEPTGEAEVTEEPTADPETPEASVRTLTELGSTLDCSSREPAARRVALGDSIVFRCLASLTVHLDGDDDVPIRVDWDQAIEDQVGWLMEIVQEPAEGHEPDWVSAESLSTNDVVTAGSDQTSELRLLVRVTRASCDATGPAGTLSVAPDVIAVDADTVVVPNEGEPRVEITPPLEPFAEPAIALNGSLDFGAVPVDAYGVASQPAPKTLLATVTGMDDACGQWELVIGASSLSAVDDTAVVNSELQLMAVNGETPEKTCDLAGGCVIATFEAGSRAEPSVTVAFDIGLTIPDETRVATLSSTLTATLREGPG